MASTYCSLCCKDYVKIHICYPVASKVPPTGIQKQKLGQFFTTNYAYILQGLQVPSDIERIVEPFAGNGDLLSFLTVEQRNRTTCYDIDVRHSYIIARDTILSPPSYEGSFVLTNPPYLARNKASDKTAFDKYGVNDLYKCLIKELLTNTPTGGILIIPLNFWSSVRKADTVLRREFLQRFAVQRLNIFEEAVFADTTTTVCSFQFARRVGVRNEHEEITTFIYPSAKKIVAEFTETNQYLLGGEIYCLPINPKYTITRLTSRNVQVAGRTNLLAKCIDDSMKARISLTVVPDEKVYVDETANSTARTYATLVIEPPISKEQQVVLAERFNTYLNQQRERYHSLFLANFRESKDLARKRISFDLVYQLVGYLLRE